MSDFVRDIVIAGGGTAGWLTAGVLAADHGERLRIRVVESPDVATIGVGEGTWPTMRDTLRRIGISEAALLRECDAAFKQGSRFDGWRNGAADDRYFHPFSLPHGYLDADLVAGWLDDAKGPFADTMTAQAQLCRHDKAPKQAATPEYAAVLNYAYHLDAVKLATLLREHCTRTLGVEHVSDHITAVESRDNGDIAALSLRERGRIEGDLFIDCTGLRALLIGEHCGAGLVAQRDVLFNDRALATQVPYAHAHDEIASQTISCAQDNGWIWDIGLPTRRGVGYVYSSAHTSDAEAEAVLTAYVAASGGPAALPSVRQIRFEPGYRETFWQRNCVAIGLSAGFIEPLEASAIVMIELSAALLSEDFPITRQDMDIVARRFNDTFSYRWKRVIDFLKLHYVLSERDQPYWRDHRADQSIPETLRELLRLWRHRAPSQRDFPRSEEIFPSASWQYILYGMGFRPDNIAARARGPLAAARNYFAETERLTTRLRDALPGNRALIDHIRQYGLPTI